MEVIVVRILFGVIAAAIICLIMHCRKHKEIYKEKIGGIMKYLLFLLLLASCNNSTRICVQTEMYECGSSSSACWKSLTAHGQPIYCVDNPKLVEKKK